MAGPALQFYGGGRVLPARSRRRRGRQFASVAEFIKGDRRKLLPLLARQPRSSKLHRWHAYIRWRLLDGFPCVPTLGGDQVPADLLLEIASGARRVVLRR